MRYDRSAKRRVILRCWAFAWRWHEIVYRRLLLVSAALCACAIVAVKMADAVPVVVPFEIGKWVAESQYIVVGKIVSLGPFDSSTRRRSGKLLVDRALYGGCAPGDTLTIYWLANEWYPKEGGRAQAFDDVLKPDAAMNKPAFWCLKWQSEDLPLFSHEPILFQEDQANELFSILVFLEAQVKASAKSRNESGLVGDELSKYVKLRAAAVFFSEAARTKVSHAGACDQASFQAARAAARAWFESNGIRVDNWVQGK
jgi:hypothetical protein